MKSKSIVLACVLGGALCIILAWANAGFSGDQPLPTEDNASRLAAGAVAEVQPSAGAVTTAEPQVRASANNVFMMESFRVWSTADNPLTQVPPQVGFVTVMPAFRRVAYFDPDGSAMGELFPLVPRTSEVTHEEEEEIPVCSVTESYVGVIRSGAPLGNPQPMAFPEAGEIRSFLCEVTFGADIPGYDNGVVVVSGPRIVEFSEPYVDPQDGLRTAQVEIIEMYLSGYDSRGALIVIKGGSNLGLPPLIGQMKALSAESDFPASLYFDLELELTDWSLAP